MKKIAFCFLIIDGIHHEELWHKYFANVDTRKYTIYIHYKTDTPLTYFEPYKLNNCIETSWGDISLVHAQNLLLEEALKDPENEHFIFVSGSCIPLKHFDYTYAYLKKKYSYFSIVPQEQCFPRCDHALSFIDRRFIQKSHQWCILNKKHAQLMVDKEKQEYLEWFISFPDEHCYITNLYVHSLENEIIVNMNKNTETTFANWDGGALKNYDSISQEELAALLKKNYLFGRKFNKECDLSTLYLKSPFQDFFVRSVIGFILLLLSVILMGCVYYKWRKVSPVKLTDK